MSALLNSRVAGVGVGVLIGTLLGALLLSVPSPGQHPDTLTTTPTRTTAVAP